MPRPRWFLQAEANFFRTLMNTGMCLHRLSPPIPPQHNFTRNIPMTVSPTKGEISLYFYTPPSYPPRPDSSRKYPVVVNFHGGGFTLGHATDDVRWAASVVSHADAIVVSVDYRLAPEHPFPTAIEDGVDALLYLSAHAEELRIDPLRVGISGFSAGGNMAFTVPLRLHEEYRRQPALPQLVIVAIATWYPSTDFTATRTNRRSTNLRPDKELPKLFTDMFDASYLYPPKSVPLDSPYLSPGVASEELLRELPPVIYMYTCEWDELLQEAEGFRVRLESEGVGKKVFYRRVDGAAHAWDKTVGPGDTRREALYKEVCEGLHSVFYKG
ncbi:unnamed protein product [Tuber melanosporum]|uniref:(Perigord truffle) hypothetical protein n=1 Tax=Tuber melanosporum (strain Mel28) TaxID=656061 RepID=D5G9I9_TUBMM|nr:uncharacterized protein GSTUM_00003345001 [Tuber melanosporum]CAZ81182.1 unnamed protein product [Tuber melanosporum]